MRRAASHEPSGGGFSEYIRVMDWIVQRGVVKIPDHVSYEQASYIEPVNTCLKGIRSLRLQLDETVLVMGQGPIGIILAVLAIGAGDRPPELPTSPRPSTKRAASPCAGQGNAGAVPTCSTAGTTEVAAVTGSGRKYWKAAAASISASRYGSGRRTSELCASARRSAVRAPARRA